MRRVIKYVGTGLGGLVLLLGVLVGVVYSATSIRLHRNYQIAVRPVSIPAGTAAIARGRHLAETRGCAGCHGGDFAGIKVVDNPAIGRLYGPNLTRGRGGLPPDFSDADWLRAITHGVAKDGHPLVLMPSLEFQHFTDDDVGNLIAYMKSIAPVDRDRVPISVGPVARVLLMTGGIELSAEHIDHNGMKPVTVTTGVTVEYGHYLSASCVGCHGGNFSGGKIPGGPPDWPPSQNLTPGGDLAKWSEADFIQTLRIQTRPDGTKLNPVMPVSFGQMDDTELKALWLFLKSLPAVENGKR